MLNKRFYGLCLLMLMIALALVGCASPPVENPSDAADYNVKLYFVNEKAVNIGDGSLEPLMPAEEMTLSSTPGGIQLATIEALKIVSSKADYGTMISDTLKINSVYTLDGTAFVDLNRENLSGSSTQETLLISQIVRTLRESFPEVLRVQFLVDGQVVESLMGHMAADKPFTE